MPPHAIVSTADPMAPGTALAQSVPWRLQGHRQARVTVLAVVATLALAAGITALLPGDLRAAGWELAAGALGVLAAVTALALSRLSRGLDALRQRVSALAAAQPAPSLDGPDELRALGRMLDDLVDDLSRRMHELEVERRSLFHQEKMAAVGAMAAGVLHDIGNPIAAIDGVARAMREAQANGECRVGEGLCDPSLILHEVTRLQAITRLIAGLAAPPSTAAQLLNVNDIVHTALALLHFDARLAGVGIDAQLDPQLPAVWGVSDSLLQMVMNLMTNAGDAVRAAPGVAPLISVKTLAAPDGVDITITDNGCGMSEDTLQRAFEPLFTTKPSGRGTGLGLPLCRSIARRHGGDVTLHSALGTGTRAQVHLAAEPAAFTPPLGDA
jgi:signal transduction histidine kinase